MTTTNQLKKTPASPLREFRLMITRNWKMKLLACVIAFLFWHMVKNQISEPPPRSFIDRHSLKESADL